MQRKEGRVARISVKTIDARSRVTVTGSLLARDLRRLERACGPALERRHVSLELRLGGVHRMDGAARAFLQRLLDRGARIVNSTPSRTRPARRIAHVSGSTS
jgi:hypothetical protein